jgi:hypothetical protein
MLRDRGCAHRGVVREGGRAMVQSAGRWPGSGAGAGVSGFDSRAEHVMGVPAERRREMSRASRVGSRLRTALNQHAVWGGSVQLM